VINFGKILSGTSSKVAVSLKTILFALLTLVGNVGVVSASERVAFATPPIQPSAFRLKRAKAQGKTAEPTPGIPLTGILSKPTGTGPHPAIVLLPQSVEARHSYIEWANHLTKNGFVTLLVESIASRGEKVLRDDQPMNLQSDAQGAHTFLSTLKFVDTQRIGLFGFGLSANFVQRSIDSSYVKRVNDYPFYAGVAMYPNCDPGMELVAPFLILAGGKDTRMSMATCLTMIEANKPKHTQTRLKNYPTATHFFDNAAYSKKPELRGKNWLEPAWFSENHYDPNAHADSKQEVLNFLLSASAAK